MSSIECDGRDHSCSRTARWTCSGRSCCSAAPTGSTGSCAGRSTTRRPRRSTHARDIVDLERSLHVFVEPSRAGLGDRHAAASTTSASWMYLNTHFVVTTCTLAFIYLFRNEHFYFVRNMFMVAMGLALVGYVALPDRAAADAAGARASRTRVADFTGVSATSSVERALQPVRRGAVDARRLRADAGRPDGPDGAPAPGSKALWCAYAPVVTFVVVATGQPLGLRRRHGRRGRGVSAVAAQTLFARARPEAWAWAPSRPPRRPLAPDRLSGAS